MKLFRNNSNYYSVFLFHGVIKKNKFTIRNYTNKHILENVFYSFLKKLKKKGNPLSLEEIIFNKKNNLKIPKNSFTITFDDGFENNYSIAAPILTDLNLPATFYFSSDFIQNNNLSWIDKVEICIEFSKNKFIHDPIDKKLINLRDVKNKISFLKKLRFNVKRNLKINTESISLDIINQTNVKISKFLDNELDKKISWQKVKSLSSNKLFTIGGHSHKHLSLTSLSMLELKKQVDRSFKLFKKNAKIDLKHYSYPEGQKIDYNTKIIKILKSKGIICCPTAISGHNHLFKDDLFNLKRIMI